jgi:hypothetical protein
MILPTRLLLLPAVALALACDDDDAVGPVRSFAAVRMFDAAAIDTLGMLWGDVDTPRVWTRFRMVSDCIQVPATERQSLRFRQIRATTDAATVDTTLVQGGRYTVIVAGTAAPRSAVLLQDVFTPPDTSTSILVRFINATSTAGDVHATPPNATLGAPIVANLPVIAAGSPPAFITLPRANTQIRLFDPGVTTGTPRANITLSGLPANRVTSVVFLDAGTPAGATAVRIDPCT